MAFKITSTSKASVEGGVKVLVYGPAGSGKTRLCATTGGNALIISAEAGLLSLREHSIPTLEVETLQDLVDAFEYVTSEHELDFGDAGKHRGIDFDWICLDSLTEIAEVVLAHEKANATDPRQAYGALIDKMNKLVRDFRDLRRNVYMSAKILGIRDEVSGGMLFGPSMPGAKLGPQLPYLFDIVLTIRTWEEDGVLKRSLQTQRDAQYECKDRSGALKPWEKPDLSSIAEKIMHGTTNQPTKENDDG